MVGHRQAHFPLAVAQRQRHPLQTADVVDEGMHGALTRRIEQTTLAPAFAARILRGHPRGEDGRAGAILAGGDQRIDGAFDHSITGVDRVGDLLIPNVLAGPVPVATGFRGQHQPGEVV